MMCGLVSYQSDAITAGCIALTVFMPFDFFCSKRKALAVADPHELEDRISFIFTLKLLFIRAYANGFTAALHVSVE